MILDGHTDDVRAVGQVRLPDGQVLIASGSLDRTVRLWDPVTRQPVGDPMKGHSGEVRAVAPVQLPDGQVLIASGSLDRSMKLWDPATVHAKQTTVLADFVFGLATNNQRPIGGCRTEFQCLGQLSSHSSVIPTG